MGKRYRFKLSFSFFLLFFEINILSNKKATTKLKNNVIASVFLILLGIYLACGFVFAVPFVLVGVKKIDPHAGHGSWGFRLLIISGAK